MESKAKKKNTLNSSSYEMYEKKRQLPITKKIGNSNFLLIISKTQIKKSTINANSIIRECFLEGGLINFDEVQPGEKKIIPCKLHISGELIETEVSFLIPKRRSKNQPEPRFWPYKLGRFVEGGTKLWFTASNNMLHIADSND